MDDIAVAFSRDGHVAAILADRGGHIRFWNKGAEVIFGHGAGDALGKRVDLVVPPAYREMHWAGFNRTIGTKWRGADGWGEIEGLHRDGSIVALEVFLTPLHDEGGLVEAVFAIFRRPAPV